MTGSPAPHETRQQKAARRVAEDERALAEAEWRIAQARAFVADHSHPLRHRLWIRVAIAFLRASRASTKLSIRLSKPDLREEPTLSERLSAKSREEFELSEQSRRRGRARIIHTPAAIGRPGLTATIAFCIGWFILGALIVANYFVFRALEINYFRWYLDNGTLINLAFSFVSLAVVLDAYPDLISSNPLRYFSACMTVLNHVILAWRDTLADDGAPSPQGSPTEQASGPADTTWWLPALFDTAVSVIMFVVMFLVAFGWALVVAPVQHVVYAVLGAPARNAQRIRTASTYDPATDATTIDAPLDRPHAGFTIGYREKPVALTSALAAAVFWLISLVA